jgi:hypothetical protein
MKSKTCVLFVVSLLLLFSAMSCDKAPVESERPLQPLLPPAQSMKINLSNFGLLQSTLTKPVFPTTQNNYNNAVMRVAIVNTVVAVHMIIPSAIFAAALAEKPILGQDGKFHWIFQTKAGVTTFEADLAGWIVHSEQKVYWEMYVTNPLMVPSLDKFIWYDGWSGIENKQGQWVFYNPQKPDEGETQLQIDWYYNNENDAQLTFKNMWESSSDAGDELDYVVADNNRSMDFLDVSKNETWQIFWDAETTAGYLHVPGYNSGEPAYWDENHQDIESL